MKALVLLVLLLVGVGLYMFLKPANSAAPNNATNTPSSHTQVVPIWEQDVPDDMEVVAEGEAVVHVRPVRRNANGKPYMDLHLTEEHGYAVDGIQVQFWYQFKDEDTGELIEDPKKVTFFIKDRLPANETLVASTVLLPVEFRNSGIDLPTTTTEDWGAKVIAIKRAMKPKN